MNIRFARIPGWAILCYVVGFAVIGISLYLYFYSTKIVSTVHLQQLFIIGALVVTAGSAINILHQFRKK